MDPHSRSYLLLACTDRTIKLADYLNSRPPNLLTLQSINLGLLGKVVGLKWDSSDPDRFVTSSDDKCMRVWSLEEMAIAAAAKGSEKQKKTKKGKRPREEDEEEEKGNEVVEKRIKLKEGREEEETKL